MEEGKTVKHKTGKPELEKVSIRVKGKERQRSWNIVDYGLM